MGGHRHKVGGGGLWDLCKVNGLMQSPSLQARSQGHKVITGGCAPCRIGVHAPCWARDRGTKLSLGIVLTSGPGTGAQRRYWGCAPSRAVDWGMVELGAVFPVQLGHAGITDGCAPCKAGDGAWRNCWGLCSLQDMGTQELLRAVLPAGPHKPHHM